MIRPVKPTAPPPPPSPPRRFSSGIRSQYQQPIEGKPDLVTPAYADPPTMAARARLQEIARELPREHRFDDETQARPEDDGAVASLWSPARRAAMDVPYDALPSLDVDAYQNHGSFEPDPGTKLSSDHDQRFGPESEYEEEPPPARRFDTAGYPGMPAEDPYVRQRATRDEEPPSSVAPAPRYDVAAYEANYPSARHNQSFASHDVDERRPDEESFAQPPPRREASYRAPQRDRGIEFQPTEQARVDDVARRYEREYGHEMDRGHDRDRDHGNAARVDDRGGYDDRDLDPRAQETHCPQKAPRRGQSYRRDESVAERAHGSYRRDARSDDRDQGSYRREASAPAPDPASYERRSDRRADREEWSAAAAPPAPAAPREMRTPPNFVMGVQPIRPGSTGPSAGYAPEPVAPMNPMAHAVTPRTPLMAPYGVSPVARPYPTARPAQQMHVRVPTTRPGARPTQGPLRTPQMTELEEAQQGSKVGRFAWFVFGAAFGIFFAFFATGLVPRMGKKEEAQFPPPAPIPTQPQAPVAAQPPPPAPQPVVAAAPVQAPMPQPQPQIIAQPPQVAPPMVPPQSVLPEAPPAPVAMAPQPTIIAPPQQPFPQPQPQPTFAAASPRPTFASAPPPAPRGQRASAIARRSAPPPPAPKAMPNSGSVSASDDDGPSVSSSREKPSLPSKEKGDIADLLNAGLAP